MQNPAKIIFFDIDDTLYNTQTGEVSPKVRYALKELAKQNIILAIATGRTPAVFPRPIVQLINECQIETIISINGQLIQHKNQIIADFSMSPQLAQQLSHQLTQHQIAHAFVSDQTISTAVENHYLNQALDSLGLSRQSNPLHYQQHPVYQLLAFYPAQQDAAIQACLPPHLKTVRWHDYGVDILEQAGSKARGIRTLLDKLQLHTSDAIAFGDGSNDHEMLATVGYSIAMGNASPELKKIAHSVCPSIHHDGVYHALLQLKLIPPYPEAA